MPAPPAPARDAPGPYLDRIAASWHLPLDSSQPWSKLLVQPVSIPDLAHTGLATNLLTDPDPVLISRPDGTLRAADLKFNVQRRVRALPVIPSSDVHVRKREHATIVKRSTYEVEVPSSMLPPSEQTTHRSGWSSRPTTRSMSRPATREAPATGGPMASMNAMTTTPGPGARQSSTRSKGRKTPWGRSAEKPCFKCLLDYQTGATNDHVHFNWQVKHYGGHMIDQEPEPQRPSISLEMPSFSSMVPLPSTASPDRGALQDRPLSPEQRPGSHRSPPPSA